ncbi:MAG: class I SAM-dependent methyltransferase [Planctomycetota bacterium]
MSASPTRVHGYDRLVRLYDPLAALWSGGGIGACHRIVADRIQPGERVLFAGAGGGRDAVAAVRRGARASLLDTSPRMLAHARRRLERRAPGAAVELRQEDVRDHRPPTPPDVVVACFFLNVFHADEVKALLGRFHGWLSPGGRLLIADFAPLRGSGLHRHLQRLHHDLPMHTFAALTGNARHPIHELGAAVASAGFTRIERRGVRLGGRGPCWYEVIEAHRAGAEVPA